MNKFDRILWRINGVLFLLLLIFGLLPLVWSASYMFSRPHPLPKDAAIVNKAQGTDKKEYLQLDDAFRIKGTPLLRMPLRGETERSSSFKSGGTSGVRNYLYLNCTDLSSWWSFEGFDRLISHVHDLRADAGGNDKPVIATLYEVVLADTDGDGRLTNNDREAVYFSGADGKKPIEIIPPTDGLLSVEQITPTEVLIIYRRDQATTAARFSVQDGSKIKESALTTKDNR